MRDPHVARLHFTIGSEEGTAYRDPPPLSFENALGKFTSKGKALVVEPASHFETEDEARAAIEPFLRSWEIESDLCFDLGTIRFAFDHAEVVDRDPPPPGTHILSLGPARVTMTAHPVTLLITRSSYPPPPTIFSATSEVAAAYQRWRNVRLGREPLLSMAYWLLTLMQKMASGGKASAAAVFNVDEKVLATLGRLASTKGDLETSRKVRPGQERLSGAEQSWLEKAVKVLIRRMGESSFASRTKISMADLPPL